MNTRTTNPTRTQATTARPTPQAQAVRSATRDERIIDAVLAMESEDFAASLRPVID